MLLEHRIQYTSLIDDQAWKRLKAFLEKYRDCFDSLALVDDGYHNAYHEMAHNRRTAEMFAKRIAELKSMGFSKVGIINIATLGHIDEGYSFLPQPLPPMTGYDGSKSRICFCPNDEQCRAHIAEEYALYANLHPDFLWVDDDVKVHTNGIHFGCFCPSCVKKFCEAYGYVYPDRESLVAAMDEPENRKLRMDWVDFISGTIDSLLAMIEKIIHDIDPTIETGFMTMRQSWSTYNGEDFHRWFKTLKAVKVRSGEGTYDETNPFALCIKAMDTAQQMEAYPDSVREKLYEIENFPYFLYQKSKRFLASECAIAAAQGFNGVLMNALKVEIEPDFIDSEPWFDAIRENRAQWDALSEFTADLHGNGFWPAISRHYDARRALKDGDSFFKYTFDRHENDLTRTYNLIAAGFPLTADREGACGAVFIGDMANGFTDEELTGFLRKGVIMDVNALKTFHERGLGEYTGVEAGPAYDDGILEYFNADDPINAGVHDTSRDIRVAFWAGTGTGLRAVKEGVRAVSWLDSYTGDRLGIACSLYENELGGRVCVMGYGAFDRVDSVARHTQLRRIADYLAPNYLAVRREAQGRLGHFVRTNGKKTSAAFINLYLDDQPPTKVLLPNMNKAWILKPDGEKFPADISENGEVMLPEIRPFETIILLAEA